MGVAHILGLRGEGRCQRENVILQHAEVDRRSLSFLHADTSETDKRDVVRM